MIIAKRDIPYSTGQIIRIKPGFDWHWGATSCDKIALKAYLSDGIDDPNCYFLSGGDLNDSIVVPDFRYRKQQDDTKTAAIMDEQMKGVSDLIAPYEGRILGLGMGNHEETILRKCGTHLPRIMSEKFHTISLGYTWALVLSFRHKRRKALHRLTIYGHHGWGGSSRTEGASITKYARHALHYEATIYLYGHDHKLDSNIVNYMGIVDGEFQPKDKHIFFPGTFKRTFSKTDEPTWEETMGFNPSPLKGMDICIQPTETWFKIWSSTN